MQRHGNITRGLIRVLALVLTLVFGLSTFHTHADASLGHDVTLTVGIDVDAVAPEKAPDKDDRHDPSGCPICALQTHILGTVPTEFAVGLIAIAERFVLTSESGRIRPPSELHRPPIDAAG